MRKNRYLVLAVAFALGAWGCDPAEDTDAGTDAGPGGTDAGTDAGPGEMDAGTDAGTAPTFAVRLINNLPGLVDAAGEPVGVHVCNFLSFGGTAIPPARLETGTLGALPFRGVSPRINVVVSEYFIAFYAPEALGTPPACPTDPLDSAAPTPVVTAVVPEDMLPEGSQISLVLSGLAPDTLGGSGASLPAICNPAGAVTFGEACTQGAQVLVIRDDATLPAAGMARLRVSNQIVNSTPPSGFTVCYDPGLVPNPAGGCIDTTPAPMMDQETLATAVAYGTVTDYSDRASFAPLGVGGNPDVGGGIYIQIEVGAGCDFAMVPGSGCYPLVSGTLIPPRGDPPRPLNVRFQLDADTINTIFISGALGLDGTKDPGEDFGPSFFIWQDDL